MMDGEKVFASDVKKKPAHSRPREKRYSLRSYYF